MGCAGRNEERDNQIGSVVEISSASVGDVWQQVLPPGSSLLGGERGLHREVTWASTLRVRPPAFPNLGLGEMALLSSDWLGLIDPPLGLAQAVDGLAQRGAAAVAVMGQIPDNAVERAEALGMPLFQLPDGTSMYELEGSIGRFISRRRTELYQRGAETHRRLMEASIQGKGMPGLLKTLAQATGRAAALLDRWRQPRHVVAPPGVKLTTEGLVSALSGEWASGFRVSPQTGGESESPVLDVPVLLTDSQAIGCALFFRGQAAGYVLLVGPAGQMGPLERLVLGQASSVFAAEMAKERAVVEAESRLKGDFLEELLEGELTDEDDMASRAEHLGYDLTGAAVVVVMAVDDNQEPMPGALDTASSMVRRILGVLPSGTPAMGRGEETVVVMRLQGKQETAEPAAKAEALRLHVSEALNGLAVVAGVGRCYPGLRGLQRSYREARRALSLGKDMAPGSSRAHFFGSLGVYPVLVPLWDTPEGEAFLEETIGRVVEYDEQNDGDMARTLETYFSYLGNLARAAGALHLHRNSLSYRLRRIEELLGVSLEDAEACFRIQLALKLHRLAKG